VSPIVRLAPLVLLLACNLPPRSWVADGGDGSSAGSMGSADAAVVPDAAPDQAGAPDRALMPEVAVTADLLPDQTDEPADVAAPPRGEPSELPLQFMFLVTSDGHLMLNLNVQGSRLPGETFTRGLTDLGATIGGLARIDEVEAQGIGLEMNLMARAQGNVSIASRRGSTWTRWTPVASGVRAMGLANHDGSLVACLADEAGRLKLATRGAGDGWGEVRDITDEASAPAARAATFTKVDCAGLGHDLEVVALDGEGRLWHATRTPTGWRPFELFPGATGRTFRSINASNSFGVLHLLGGTQTTQYHTARSFTGEWIPFEDIEQRGAMDPGGTVVAGGQAASFFDVWWTQVTSAGDLWISVRDSDVIVAYWLEQPAPSAANPYVGAVMAFTVP
jgi:hypothetical protein